MSYIDEGGHGVSGWSSNMVAPNLNNESYKYHFFNPLISKFWAIRSGLIQQPQISQDRKKYGQDLHKQFEFLHTLQVSRRWSLPTINTLYNKALYSLPNEVILYGHLAYTSAISAHMALYPKQYVEIFNPMTEQEFQKLYKQLRADAVIYENNNNLSENPDGSYSVRSVDQIHHTPNHP